MLLSASITNKTVGAKQLLHDVQINVAPKEKLALIGRNGVGKTTLFGILTQQDTDFEGDLHMQRGTRVVSTAQEHHAVGDQTALEYLTSTLPDYARLNRIITTYPDTMGDDLKKLQTFSNALEHFSSLGYYEAEDKLLQSLANYQITPDMARMPLARLSGGQKRFVELVRIEHAQADLALIDEPTNHMDYAAKESFIAWLKSVKFAVVVITHDRDVLQHVDRIIEIKDGTTHNFSGNYTSYLKQNASNIVGQMHSYEVGTQTLANLQKKIAWARARKPGWNGKGERNPYDVMERRLQKEYDALQAQLQKPSFWIDRESAEGLRKTAQDNYAKYKAKNINITNTNLAEHERQLLTAEDIQLGYGDSPLFKPLTFSLAHGDRLQLVGRNGAGKTTLVRAIIDASQGKRAATYKAGSIFCDQKLRLSVYEQEISGDILNRTLADAIEHIYLSKGQNITSEQIMRIMSNYLFSPHQDGELPVTNLSGGQKARLQLISMMANNPNLLILDEPTNHLDLPSIEELENTLQAYQGAILYVSHDSYFAKNIGGERVTLTPLTATH